MNLRGRHSRRGGAVTTFIGIFILLMVALAFARAVPGMLSGLARDFVGQDRGDCGTGGGTSVDAASKSAVLSELHNSSFWAMVRASAENTTQHLVHDTIVAYMDKDQEWRNWSLKYMPDAARWADTGFGPYIDAQVALLQARALASGNVTEAFGVLEDQISRASSVVLAGVDFVFFNSATGLRIYLETGNATQALCSTYASQLQQLWDQAFNPNLTEQERAHYLGQALAISTVTVALAGTDGVSSKFKAALDKVGLADSWETVKPYLGKIGSTVSAKAAYLTFTLLERLAKRFPGSRTWEAGFVSDRIDAMAEVLHEKGFSNGVIEQKIQGLIEATSDAGSPENIAHDADLISYRDGHELKVKLDTENRILLYTDQETAQYIGADFLQQEVPGFPSQGSAFLKVTYIEKGVTVYHYYGGGTLWRPTTPSDIAGPHDILTVRIALLTREEFVSRLPDVILSGYDELEQGVSQSKLTGFTISSDKLEMHVTQAPQVQGISEFTIQGTASQTLQFNGGLTYLQFEVTDLFGRTRQLIISHDGYGSPSLGIISGDKFRPVVLVSSDGVRLRISYSGSSAGVENRATIYLGDPSVLYKLGDVNPYTLLQPIKGVSNVFQIGKVDFARSLEGKMLTDGSSYDHGRLGVEIAYTVSVEKLSLKDVIIEEPSRGGKDLYSIDGRAVIQARFIEDFSQFQPLTPAEALQDQLVELVSKLGQDFDNNPSATMGYAILSYADDNNIVKTIVAEVTRP